MSPARGASVAVQVQDTRGLGVNGEVLLVTAARGTLVANPAFAGSPATLCAGTTVPSLALTSNASDVLTPGGRALHGTADFVVCAASGGDPGDVMVTVESITRPLPPATLRIGCGGRPARIHITVEADRLTARVTDQAGSPVADGTPIRFALSPLAGVLSVACALTRGGEATVVAGLDVPVARVLVSAEFATAGTAATCASPGAQQVITSAVVAAPAVVPR